MTSFRFNSRYSLGAALPDFDEMTVKNEPMLFNCDYAAARELGGPITHAFLDALGSEPVVIDTRVHMLMKGWFPCIPGWHHDDIPRSRSDGQPNYVSPEYRARHAMALINGDICATEFAVGECELPDVPIGGVIYREWHPMIDNLCDNGVLERQSAPSNRVIDFDDESIHQGVRAVRDGWRWFGRVSWDTGRVPTNELRRQVQCYLDKTMDGW